MVSIIIKIFIFLIPIGIGIYFALKKHKKKKKIDEDNLLKEFEEGKIILPIDKRDFKDFKDFKEKTKHIESVKDKFETIDTDFEKFKFIVERDENGNPREEDN